jgi:hypothetical protein
VKKVNLENLEDQESPVSQDFQENLEDLVILVCREKWEIKVSLENLVIRVKEVKGGLLVL